MPIYQILIRGENLPMGEGHALMGFYAMRNSEAENIEKAELDVIHKVKSEIISKVGLSILQQADSRMYLEEWCEIEHMPGNLDAGFTFFPMAEEE